MPGLSLSELFGVVSAVFGAVFLHAEVERISEAARDLCDVAISADPAVCGGAALPSVGRNGRQSILSDAMTSTTIQSPRSSLTRWSGSPRSVTCGDTKPSRYSAERLRPPQISPQRDHRCRRHSKKVSSQHMGNPPGYLSWYSVSQRQLLTYQCIHHRSMELAEHESVRIRFRVALKARGS